MNKYMESDLAEANASLWQIVAYDSFRIIDDSFQLLVK